MVIWGVALTLSESSLLLHHNLSWGKWACGRDPWGQCSLAPLANCGACKKFNKQLPSGWPSFVGRYSELTMKQGKYVDSQKRLDQHHRLETSPGGPWWLWGGMEGHGRCRVYSLLLEFAFISSVECSCSMALHVSAKHPAGWSPSLTGCLPSAVSNTDILVFMVKMIVTQHPHTTWGKCSATFSSGRC